MPPNIIDVAMTSNEPGSFTSCMATASGAALCSSTSGKSAATSSATRPQMS
jgi:hypothetical protein